MASYLQFPLQGFKISGEGRSQKLISSSYISVLFYE
jgi:hypothetical protein